MCWQGHLRAIADDYDQVIVCGPTGHDAMYEFADRYINYDAPTLKANMFMNHEVEADAEQEFSFYVGGHEFSNNGHIEWINPRKVWNDLLTKNKAILVNAIQPQKFRRFGNGGGDGYDILYHARKRDDWDSSYRNWLPDDCKKVLHRFHGMKIGAIGRGDMAYHLGEHDDLREIPLAELTDIMARSKLLVGPISGPIHLATLCGLPQMTWAVKAEHADRVRNKWNPFNTKTEVICSPDDSIWHNRIKWTPPVDDIVAGMEKVLECRN